jgi:hypothetical protein
MISRSGAKTYGNKVTLHYLTLHSKIARRALELKLQINTTFKEREKHLVQRKC